ncbi:MAG: tetratricopeptide repeat protein [Rhodoferax sp.]
MTPKKTRMSSINKLLKLAGAGDGAAACRLGDAYREGNGVTQDWEQAFRWYTAAARAGDAEGQNNLGTLYLEGLYCPEDHEKALYWYRKSAEQGACVAQYNLGMRYLHGQAVEVDNVEAMRWLEKSVAQGYNIARYDLGIMHLLGEGCTPDRQRALRLLMESATNGDPRAVKVLTDKLPELEELALAGSLTDWLSLSDLYFEDFKVTDAKAHGWAWLLWAQAHYPEDPTFDFGVVGRLEEIMMDEDKRGKTSATNQKKGEKLFKAMLHERNIAMTVKSASAMAASTGRQPNTTPVRLPDQWQQACDPNARIESRLIAARPGATTILDLAAEGGGVDVIGVLHSDASWRFWCSMSDWTPTLEGDDAIHRSSDTISSWNELIDVLDDKFPYWVSLYPVYVHHAFRRRMAELIEHRLEVSHLTRSDRKEL